MGKTYPGHNMEGTLRTEHVDNMTTEDYKKVNDVRASFPSAVLFLLVCPILWPDPVLLPYFSSCESAELYSSLAAIASSVTFLILSYIPPTSLCLQRSPSLYRASPILAEILPCPCSHSLCPCCRTSSCALCG